jgi:poly(3-hydroxybutyrate) depolymerase
MMNRLVFSLIGAAIGVLSLACTAEDPDPGVEPGPSAGMGPSGGGAGSVAGSPGIGGGAPVAGTPNGGGGVPGVAGAGGMVTVAGAGGQATAGAGGGGGSGGGGEPGKSAGCGKEPGEEPRKYVQHDMVVNVAPAYAPKFTNRKYFTYLPNNYDPNKAYPVVFYGAGCGATMSEPQPAMQVFNDQAILVFLLQIDSCFQAGSSGTADSPDIPYFDQALTEIETNYCVDPSRVFMSGYSSGAWFSITLSCSHGDKIRGIAVAAGGQQPALPACKGQPAALFYVSSNDGGNPTGGNTGSIKARDRLIMSNGCQMTTMPWADGRWPSCQKYQGCDQAPVVWCDHMGGHSNGQGGGDDKMASEGWWKFFTELP